MENQIANIYGNEKLISFFGSAAENGKLAHAYIFEGGRGSGKHLLARRLSCLLACNSLFDRPCFMCESCRKISEGISPDIIEIGVPDDKKTIGVDQIRDLRSSAYIKPSEEDIKVYIISNAEAMTEQAQNVFLKVLEEPPKNVYFFMLCENTSNILATVKSRAPVLKMQVFSDEELSAYLINNNSTAKALQMNNPDEFSLIVRIAEGKIGQAERLLADSGSDKSQSRHGKAGKLIELSADSSAFSELLMFAQKMAPNRDTFVDIVLYAMYAARDLMAVKKCDSENIPLLFYSDNNYAYEIASKFTAAGVMTIYDLLCDARNDLAMNANLGIIATNLAYELRRAANL
ncbi:MAG: hypothetical protein IKU45_01520 [Clostridia bacterium]|nr:hypothetical protein [Clostridia bacterium]